MKKLFKKKGFTLVEMIVAMAVTALLCAAAMMLFNSVSGIISGLKGNVNVDVATDTISTYLFDRMSTCSTYNIGVFPVDASGNLVLDETDVDSSSFRVNAHLVDISGKSVPQVLYAMVIMNDGEGSRIYDLGAISSVDEYEERLAQKDKWRLFVDDYYEGMNFKYTFETVKTGGGDSKTWCKIGVAPYDENDEPVISPRYQMFNVINSLYNENVVTSSLLPESNADLKDTPTDNGIVILYRIRDFSVSVT